MLHKDSYLVQANSPTPAKKSVTDFSMEVVDRSLQDARVHFSDKLIKLQPHTPLQLINQLTDPLCAEKLQNKDASILVVYTIEWAVNLRMRGYTNITLITEEYDPFIQKLLTKFGINYTISEKVLNMRFNVGVGNPPFSAPKVGKTPGKRAEELYTKFFARTLDMCDTVAMVLPTTDQKVQKAHNDLLKEHANYIIPIDPALFPGIAMDMWYVVCDHNDGNVYHNTEWALDGTGNNIPWKKGGINMTDFKKLTGGHGDSQSKFDSDITVYHKINEKGLVTVYARESVVSKIQRFPESGYAVLMPQTFNNNTGWSLTEIVKCTGRQAAFNGMNIVFTKTLKQAKDLVEHMKTPEFIAEGNRVKQGFNNMILSSLRSIKTDYVIK